MISYKYFHLDRGYGTTYSTEDIELIEGFKYHVDKLRNITAKPGETAYIYLKNSYFSVYFKSLDSNCAALFDINDELATTSPDAITPEVFFNDKYLKITNSSAPATDVVIKGLKTPTPAIGGGALLYVPKVLDCILSNGKIAIIGSSTQIQTFIKLVIYLLPRNYSKNIGYIVNASSMPEVYADYLEGVQLFAFTNPYVNLDDMDLVVNLNESAGKFSYQTGYGKVLSHSAATSGALQQACQELEVLFTPDAKYSKDLEVQLLSPKLFELDKTVENAENLLKHLSNVGKVNCNQFHEVCQFVIKNKLYSGQIAFYIDKIISKNSEFESMKLLFKETTIVNNLKNIKSLNQASLNDIISFYLLEETEITEEAKTALLNNKYEANTFSLLLELLAKSKDEVKRNLILEFLQVERTYDVKIAGTPFNDYIINKIYSYKDSAYLELASRFLYSTVLKENVDKAYAKTRKSAFLKKFINNKASIDNVKVIFDIYKRIKELIEVNKFEEILDYHEITLFTDEQLAELIAFNPRKEESDYFNLIKFASEYDLSHYPKFQTKIISAVLAKDRQEVYLYKKYVNVHTVDSFIEFFNNSNVTPPSDVSEFIENLRTERQTSVVLEIYRLDFIYNTYLSIDTATRKKIARKLAVSNLSKMDEGVKAIIYNENGQGNAVSAKTQKEAIDYIIDLAKKDDSINVEGKKPIFGSLFLFSLLALFITGLNFLVFNLPTIIKHIMFDKGVLDIYFSSNNMYAPFALAYAFLAFFIIYLVSVKKTRRNIGQAYGLTLLNTLYFITLPFLAYAASYMLIYFFL